MDLRLLRYFMALAEELHFGRAATRLHISQPPLSQQIRLLEEELGTPLFERSHHRVELTPAGKVLKQQAPLVFEQLERALDLTRQTGRGQLGELEIGMISSVMVGVLPRALSRFRERYPQVTWRLHEMTPAAQLTALKEKRIVTPFSMRNPVRKCLRKACHACAKNPSRPLACSSPCANASGLLVRQASRRPAVRRPCSPSNTPGNTSANWPLMLR